MRGDLFKERRIVTILMDILQSPQITEEQCNMRLLGSLDLLAQLVFHGTQHHL